MLKQIAVRQLRLGMHLHKLDGSWLSHPFWKTQFVLTSANDLRRLLDCGVPTCWIDTALGKDVLDEGASAGSGLVGYTAAAGKLAAGAVSASASSRGSASCAAPGSASASHAAPHTSATRSTSTAHGTGSAPAGPSTPLNEELRQAAAICDRSREAVLSMFSEARMGRTVDAQNCLPLVGEIASSVQRNPGALMSLARLKTRDDYSYMHSVAVCALMVALAQRQGMDEDGCRQAGLAGLLHDIGKAMVPLDVLNKPGPLTADEFAIVRAHPEHGAALLQDTLRDGAGMGTQAGQGSHAGVVDVVLHHHEKMDGSGYPHGLAGDAISVLARMGAICDVYDAITSNRPYKAGWDPAESIARMASWQGHFDPQLFDAFVQSLGIYPIGSRVRLASGQLAVVVEQTPKQPMAPVVKPFYSIKQQARIKPQALDLSRTGCHDRIVGRDGGEHGTFERLEELWVDPELLRRVPA